MDELSLGILIALLGLGLVLVLVEFFLIPGTTVVGIVGGLLMVISVILAFSSQGTEIGLYFMVAAFLGTGLLFYSGFKVYTSKKYSVNAEINSRNYLQETSIELGTEGITVTDLRPGGKAKFGKDKFEVYSQDEYIDSGRAIEVLAVQDNKIFVKSKKK